MIKIDLMYPLTNETVLWLVLTDGHSIKIIRIFRSRS